MIFTNKHVIIAMIVAPILAVLSYYLVDSIVAEKPRKALPGQTYKLVGRPNCRYESGLCELKNNDLILKVTGTYKNTLLQMKLSTSTPLQKAVIASGNLVQDTMEYAPPQAMQVTNEKNTEWQLDIPAVDSANSAFRLVVHIENSGYFAEFPAIFLQDNISKNAD